MNVFLFPDLYSVAGCKAALLKRLQDAVFGVGTLTSFAYTILLLGIQKVAPVDSWEKAASQLKLWAVFCVVVLGAAYTYLATSEMIILVEETTFIRARLHAQCL